MSDTALEQTTNPAALIDRFGRRITYLRISVTDRCDFRCVYCMPKEIFGRDHPFLKRKELLSFEEIYRLACVFAALGGLLLRYRPQLNLAEVVLPYMAKAMLL